MDSKLSTECNTAVVTGETQLGLLLIYKMLNMMLLAAVLALSLGVLFI